MSDRDAPEASAPTPPVRGDVPQRTISDPVGYWRANRRLIAILLSIWGGVSIGLAILLAGPLDQVKLGGVTLGFWIAQQGAIYVFVILIFIYAWQMDRLDRKHGVDE